MTPAERRLNGALRMLSESGPQAAPESVERNLLEAFRGYRRRRRIARWASVGGGIAAIAASVVVAGLTLRTAPPAPPVVSRQAKARPTPVVIAENPVAKPRRRVVRKAARAEPADFYALPDAESGIPLEHATVVRVQLPLSALRDVGLAVNEQSAAERVQADVLLGQDGLARAVRFVKVTSN